MGVSGTFQKYSTATNLSSNYLRIYSFNVRYKIETQ